MQQLKINITNENMVLVGFKGMKSYKSLKIDKIKILISF